MREFKATEAKARFSELLRMVEHGETIAITRQGKVVAHLVPAWRKTGHIGQRLWRDSASFEQGGGASTTPRKTF